MVAAPASLVASAAAVDGRGKDTARSAAACEEDASTSLAEAVVAEVAVASAAATAGAMAAVVAATSLTGTFSSGTICAAVVAVLSDEAIATAPLVFGRRR